METSSKKRSAPNDNETDSSIILHQSKKKKSSPNTNDSPIAGTRITDWNEYEKLKEVRGDIEPTMNYVEITPEAVEEIRKIKNIIGDYICQLCKVKYENAFALAMHKCPRVVHIEFRCPECDKTFNCPANLASHRRWHKPQPSASTNESTTKTATNKHLRCSSRSDSRSTNTSSSTVSDIIHEYPFNSATSTSDIAKKDSSLLIGAHRKPSDHVLRAMFNGNSQRIFSSTFQSLTNSYMKHPLFYPNHRPLSISSSFDLHRLQSSCIFCHEQFAEVNHLLQHIRKNHSVTSNENNKNTTVTLDKIVF